MTTSNREVEAKYTIDSPAALRRIRNGLRRLPPPFTQGRTRRVRLLDRYLDTEGRDLAANGWALRIRRRDRILVLALKSLGSGTGGIHTRQELETEIAAEREHSWPQQIREVVAAIAAGRKLRTVARIEQRRELIIIRAQGRDLLEISLDRVRQRLPLRRRYCLLEIELLADGSLRDLKAVAGQLQSRFRLRPDPLSKLEHALCESPAR